MMSSPPPESTVCGSCEKTESQLSNPLKRCAKCRLQWYCSRECQKLDWKSHKKTCGNTRVEPASTSEATSSRGSARPTSTFNAASSASYRNNPQALCYIAKPFTALDNGTWLHNRPKKDVYKLLVDTYRMRMEDEYVFQGDVDEDSLYSGAGPASALRHFKRFLNKTIRLDAVRNQKLLPEWWSKNSLQECMDLARTDEFSNVGLAAEKHDIQDHYSQKDMPVQLRMFSEKIDGTQATGMSCELTLKMQVDAEKGLVTSTLLSF